jgi:hypothetical protein
VFVYFVGLVFGFRELNNQLSPSATYIFDATSVPGLKNKSHVNKGAMRESIRREEETDKSSPSIEVHIRGFAHPHLSEEGEG